MVPFPLRQKRSLMLWEENTGWLFIRVLLFSDEHKMDSVLIMVNIKCNTQPLWWRRWFWVGMKMKIHQFLTNALNISWVTYKISVPQCIYSVRMLLFGSHAFLIGYEIQFHLYIVTNCLNHNGILYLLWKFLITLCSMFIFD